LQAVLVSVLALYGFWGCAFVVLVILLPWKPILAVGGYLAQPVVDWRVQKARARHEKGIAQIEEELDALLRAPKLASGSPVPAASAKPVAWSKPSPETRRLESFKPKLNAPQDLQKLSETAEELSAAVAIRPVIKHHVKNLPQGVFSNMELEVEEVKFRGETAEAYVKFQSPNVAGLVIRQRYLLRKTGGEWQVESRQPANGASKAPPAVPRPSSPAMRLT
jgi:hypothetical protein